MKSKRVWGYKLTAVSGGHGKKEYVRYTPMEFEVDGMRFWYETCTDDTGKYFSVTHADSGIKVSTISNCKVNELAERFSMDGKMVESINYKLANKDERLLHESMEKMPDIMQYTSQFDSVNSFLKGKEGNYPPEKIPYDADFRLEQGILKMFV